MTTFLYDGDGGRVKKTANGVATLYIGKLFECVLPCTPDGTATQYVFAGGERIASRITGGAPPPNPESDALVLDAVALSTTLYYHGDHLGSNSVITDADGRPQQRLAYMPYGATQANSGTLDVRHKYTGQELDAEIGLYFYNARYYDPVLGRFTQADTIVPNPANPQTLNRYSYALNNPMRYTDPTGYLSEGDLGPGLQFDPAYYASTPDPSSSFLSTDFTSANPYSLDLSVPDLTIDTSFAPLPTASDITATSTGEPYGVGGPGNCDRCMPENISPPGQTPQLDYHSLFESDESITSPYGERIHPITGITSFHGGIDVVPRPNTGFGTPLLAPTSGQITGITPGGFYFRPDASTGRLFFYHVSLSPNLAGTPLPIQVQGGNPMGNLANVGNLTGPHVHIQLESGRSLFDPRFAFP